MSDLLAEFLDDRVERRFVWGSNDCLLLPADWLRALGRPDPAAEYRGAYCSRAQAEAILEAAGGFLALVERQMRATGYPETSAPAAGDVGVVEVETPEGHGPVGAIFDGLMWTALGVAGLVSDSRFRLVKAWSVNACPRP